MEKYAIVSREILHNPEISRQGKMIYVTLCSFCEQDQRECDPPAGDLIRESGMSKNTFYKHMSELELNGIVKKYYVRTGPRPLDRKLRYQLCE